MFHEILMTEICSFTKKLNKNDLNGLKTSPQPKLFDRIYDFILAHISVLTPSNSFVCSDVFTGIASWVLTLWVEVAGLILAIYSLAFHTDAKKTSQ